MYLVLVLAGTASVAMLNGGLASTPVEASDTAAGRTAVVAAAAGLAGEYGLAAATTPLFMAGSLAAEAAYVVAAMTDEPFLGTVVALADVTGAEVRRHVALAIAAVEQALGVDRGQPLPLPEGAELGMAPPEAVAVDLEATDDGTRLFNARNVHDASHQDQARWRLTPH